MKETLSKKKYKYRGDMKGTEIAELRGHEGDIQ
jgi:hypothetical protein